MRNPERWLAFHLSVLTLVVLAIIAALILEGLGFAFIVALALGIVLAIGYPLLVIRAEGKVRPPVRRRQ
jgi:hypothetical protein